MSHEQSWSYAVLSATCSRLKPVNRSVCQTKERVYQANEKRGFGPRSWDTNLTHCHDGPSAETIAFGEFACFSVVGTAAHGHGFAGAVGGLCR